MLSSLRVRSAKGDKMYRFAWVAACVCLAASTALSQDPDKTGQIEQEVRQAIKEFDEAAARGDTPRIQSFIADQYFHTDVYGKVQDKAAWLEEYFRPLAAGLKAGEFKWDVYYSDEIQVRAYGNEIAVAIGRWNLKRNTGPRVVQGRFTHVWVKRKGRWQRAVYQATLIAQQENR